MVARTRRALVLPHRFSLDGLRTLLVAQLRQ
jgi:hypothetical protein